MSQAQHLRADWLNSPATQAACAMLTGAGHAAWLVGGCVRDALLHLPVADLDITTDAAPETILALAKAAGLRALPTGIAHGTVTVIIDGTAFEITTLRRDIATDGRHATVAFTTDIAQDAARRDFTINALYADATGRVRDPLGGGLADLEARRVRFIGDPARRIAEDDLRILRFFRFHAHYADPAGGIDAQGLAACAAGLDGLAGLSRERVGAEVRKLLSAPDPAPATAAMAQAGVLAAILPGADPLALAPLIHLESQPPTTGIPPHWLRRLAVLGGADPGAALRLSRAELRDLSALRDAIARPDPPAALGYRLGAGLATDATLARAALMGMPPAPGWQSEIAHGAQAQFPVRAADLMPNLQGPALGAELTRLQDRWIASGFRLTRAELLA
ncbi:CCA tRNA nucleotidyltransferase [Roseicitreum antarcticum]|uniref:Poly(A) polymerase n=1 Tax=Roseicitreum antarcticum TaxID=564137 RepID=A0A1H2X2U5_9RHOB|nr:CCA tRNA nucleotidyltransferase [Roseicitreum antarcticum]SDW87108.1 poly(A) polymerase [Roseicitreum antarcticum]